MAESGDWSVRLRCCVLEPPGAAFVLLELSVKLMQLRKKDAWRWCLGTGASVSGVVSWNLRVPPLCCWN